MPNVVFIMWVRLFHVHIIVDSLLPCHCRSSHHLRSQIPLGGIIELRSGTCAMLMHDDMGVDITIGMLSNVRRHTKSCYIHQPGTPSIMRHQFV